MGIVNRYCRGLLSLLDAKTQGDTPSAMGDVIAPTMDIGDYLYASKGLESASAYQNAAPVLNGNYAPVTVPDGEIWFVRRISAGCANPDAVLSYTAKVIPLLRLTALSDAFPLVANGIRQAMTPGEGTSNAWEFPTPLVVQSGAIFVAYVQQASVAVPPALIDYFTIVQFHRLTT